MIKTPVTAAIVLALTLTAIPALAQRSPVVHLSSAKRQALGLKLVHARMRTLHARRTFYGDFTLPPNAEAVVTPRIRGRVTALYVTVGDRVRRGAALARVQSLLVGSPPPSVIVHAPMDGVVATRPAVLGEAAAPGTLLYRLMKPHRLWLKAYVYQQDVAVIHQGQEARIRALGVTTPLQGRVVMVAPRVNPRRGAETIWIALTHPPAALRPALFARAHVMVASAQMVAVPSNAVVDVGNRHALFVAIGGDRFRYTPVTVGIREHGYCGVSGLKAGARVVTQGNAELYTLWLTGGKLKADS